MRQYCYRDPRKGEVVSLVDTQFIIGKLLERYDYLDFADVEEVLRGEVLLDSRRPAASNSNI